MTSPLFPPDDRRSALIVIPTVATPTVLLPCFTRLLEHLDGIPVHVCVSINPINQEHGDTCQREVVKLWKSYAQEGLLPAESLLTVYRHPGPCGFGGALNRGILAAATDEWVSAHEDEGGNIGNPLWPEDMHREDGVSRVERFGDDGYRCLLGSKGVLVGPYGLPPLTIFYNDDLEATSGWLAELVAGVRPDNDTIYDLCESPNQDGTRKPRPVAMYGRLGLIGPVTNLAAGMQGLVKERDTWKRLGSDRFAANWRIRNAGQRMTADFLSGFCMGITRDCLQALWGKNPERDGLALFDERTYPIAGYEDNDLCVRAAEAGYRAAICIGSFVGHIGHQTFDAHFPGMERGMRNRLNYYRKWRLVTNPPAIKLVAALRVKIEVPHDLRLLRPTLQRLGMLVDGVAILFTADPFEALAHAEAKAEIDAGEIPDADLKFLNAMRSLRKDNERRAKRAIQWVQECVQEGAQAAKRPVPKVGVVLWPDQPMNERNERNANIRMAEAMGADWIWSIDHDEVVEPRIMRDHLDRWMRHPDPLVSSLDQGFYDTWNCVQEYRTDPPWGDGGRMTGGRRGWRLWRVNKAAPGRILAGTENGLHCGNSPTSDPMTKRHAAIRIYHHGCLRAEDRRRKYERYKRQDPNPDPALVGGPGYEHLVNEERMVKSGFAPRCGIGLHMLAYDGEPIGGVMSVLDQCYAMTDAVALVWTSEPAGPAYEDFKDVAALFGASVVEHPIDWQTGGLAEARNAGIDALTRQPHADGLGWSLFLDPDEHLPDGALISIRRLADASDCWGWIFPYKNPGIGGDHPPSESIRMARLVPEMRMDGWIHEGFASAVIALKRAGYGSILRTAPFECLNTGLLISDDKLQAKYDRYFERTCKAFMAGKARSVDWITVGLYFANEGLWTAPEACFARAVDADQESFYPPRELAVHYMRKARHFAALSASRLPEGDPKHDHVARIVQACDQEAPPIAGLGLAGKRLQKWTEERAEGLIALLDLAWAGNMDLAGEAPSAEPAPAEEPTPDQPVWDQTPCEPIVLQEDDGTPE